MHWRMLLIVTLALCAPILAKRASAASECEGSAPANADGQCSASAAKSEASYLSVPRLTFAGYFQADVATGNNDPEHFDSNAWRTSYNRQEPSQVDGGGWCAVTRAQLSLAWLRRNPQGTLAFRFVDCKITSLTHADGRVDTYDQTQAPAQVDPLLNGFVEDSGDTVAAKIVDLDPEFQLMVSQIWGMKIGIEGAFTSNMVRFLALFFLDPRTDCIHR